MTGSGTGPAHLEISELAVSFGGVRAVDGVSLELSPGEVVALVGPNGSGKTTLLDAISGLVTPSAGRVVLDGEGLDDMLPEERAAMGLVRSFQDARLFPELTVEDTLLLSEDGRNSSDVVSITFQLPWARRSERVKRADVDAVIGSFRLGAFRHRRIGQLSTGTRRVVDLASIVLASPRLLLLDEPTAGIAQREAEAFVPLLRRLQHMTGCTVLLVEHDVPLAFELCDRAVVMQTGTIVSAGPPEVVRRDPLALEAYLGASEDVLRATGPLAPAQPAGGLAGP
ncbi:MAG TPA: ATP-binding cassette domain-containing protein [Acidimicrobiales bacterium]|nr:ATP-binding cassette domain-containing protein [Acidimicrobiales bacterium]